MDNFITFSESELDFLFKMRVVYKGNCFLSENGEFTYVKANYRRVKEFGSDSDKYTTYEFKGKKGETITFVRGNNVNDVNNDKIPSVMYEKNGIVVAFGEKVPDNLYVDSKENLTEEMKDILKKIKPITIQVKFKNSKKYQGAIIICVDDEMGQTYTSLRKNLNQVALIEGFMSNIYRVMNGNRQQYNDISPEYYSDVLIETIKKVYADEPDLIDIFSRLEPLYTKVYEGALYLPSINERALRIEYQNERDDISHHYDEIINKANNKKQEELAKITKRENDFDRIIQQYHIQEKQK